MTGATGNIYVGLHEIADMMFPLHFLRKGDLFLEIGANIGSYTVLASGVCRARTRAFEPDPNALYHLTRNIAINELDSLVTIYECALGPTQGELPFTVGLDTVNRVAAASDKKVRLARQERLDEPKSSSSLFIRDRPLVETRLPTAKKIEVLGRRI